MQLRWARRDRHSRRGPRSRRALVMSDDCLRVNSNVPFAPGSLLQRVHERARLRQAHCHVRGQVLRPRAEGLQGAACRWGLPEDLRRHAGTSEPSAIVSTCNHRWRRGGTRSSEHMNQPLPPLREASVTCAGRARGCAHLGARIGGQKIPPQRGLAATALAH